jgi:hypothetical protein
MPAPGRVAFPLVLQSPISGSAIVGAKATITTHVVGAALGSGPAAEIFLTETEASKVAGNVITTDNTGRWTQGEGASPAYAQYWLAQGTYDILISGAGLTSVYVTRELVSASSLISTPYVVNIWLEGSAGVPLTRTGVEPSANNSSIVQLKARTNSGRGANGVLLTKVEIPILAQTLEDRRIDNSECQAACSMFFWLPPGAKYNLEVMSTLGNVHVERATLIL